MSLPQATGGLAQVARLSAPGAEPTAGPDERGKLAEAMLRYAANLRRSYPSDAGNDPLTLGMNQIAHVLEHKAQTTAPMALRLWVTQYAQALFWAHPDRNDPYSVGVCGVAGDLEVALLAWGDPSAPRNEFQDVAAGAFGVVEHDKGQ